MRDCNFPTLNRNYSNKIHLIFICIFHMLWHPRKPQLPENKLHIFVISHKHKTSSKVINQNPEHEMKVSYSKNKIFDIIWKFRFSNFSNISHNLIIQNCRRFLKKIWTPFLVNSLPAFSKLSSTSLEYMLSVSFEKFSSFFDILKNVYQKTRLKFSPSLFCLPD